MKKLITVIVLVALVFSGSLIVKNVKETKANNYVVSLKAMDSKTMLEELKEKGLKIPLCYEDDEQLELHTKLIIDLWARDGITNSLPFDYDGYDKLAKEIIKVIY